MNKRVYNYNKLKRHNKRNLKNQSYVGSITGTTLYFYICALETELRKDRQMVRVISGYLLEAHLFRKKKKLSTLEVKTGESIEPFHWYTINKTRDAERPHTVQYH
jgi:hypothetical protein